jgi:fluoride exporter
VLERLAVIFVGGCVGGYSRYAVTHAWPTPNNGFPWSTFTVNLVGAFVLGVVVVLAAETHRARHLRVFVGTGFCGALTTFSSVVVAVDELLAHHHATTAFAYLAATAAAGLAVAAVGLAVTRSLVARW